MVGCADRPHPRSRSPDAVPLRSRSSRGESRRAHIVGRGRRRAHGGDDRSFRVRRLGEAEAVRTRGDRGRGGVVRSGRNWRHAAWPRNEIGPRRSRRNRRSPPGLRRGGHGAGESRVAARRRRVPRIGCSSPLGGAQADGARRRARAGARSPLGALRSRVRRPAIHDGERRGRDGSLRPARHAAFSHRRLRAHLAGRGRGHRPRGLRRYRPGRFLRSHSPDAGTPDCLVSRPGVRPTAHRERRRGGAGWAVEGAIPEARSPFVRGLSDALGGKDDWSHERGEPGHVAPDRIRRRGDASVPRRLRGGRARAAPLGGRRGGGDARGPKPGRCLSRPPDAYRRPPASARSDSRRPRAALRPRGVLAPSRRSQPGRARSDRTARPVVVAGRPRFRDFSRCARSHRARRANRTHRERARSEARGGLRGRLARCPLRARRSLDPRRACRRCLRPAVGTPECLLGRGRPYDPFVRRARRPCPPAVRARRNA